MNDREFIEGCNLIHKHTPEQEKDSYNLHAEHDQFWYGDFEWIPEGADYDRLIKLGWFQDEDSWSCFT